MFIRLHIMRVFLLQFNYINCTVPPFAISIVPSSVGAVYIYLMTALPRNEFRAIFFNNAEIFLAWTAGTREHISFATLIVWLPPFLSSVAWHSANYTQEPEKRLDLTILIVMLLCFLNSIVWKSCTRQMPIPVLLYYFMCHAKKILVVSFISQYFSFPEFKNSQLELQR